MSFFEDASLVLIPSGIKNQKIYSVKPTDGTGDLTFTRASNATRVDSNGLIEKVRTNLVLQSNTFSNATWVKGTAGTGVSVTSGQSGYDGTSDAWLLAKNLANEALSQSISFSGLATFSVYAKAGTTDWVRIGVGGGTFSSAYFDLTNAVVGATTTNIVSASIVAVSSGWYRCSIVTNKVANAIFIYPAEGDNDTSGLSGNILIQASQLEVGDIATDYIATTTTAVSVGPVSGLPRLDYLNSSCPRLLLEPQRTNLALFSEQFDNAGWTKTNASVTANAGTSPDGYVNADNLVENTANAVHLIQQAAGGFGVATYAISVFAKSVSGNRYLQIWNGNATNAAVWARFDLENGTVTQSNGIAGTGYSISSATITSYGNGWYRCAIATSKLNTTGANTIQFRLSQISTGVETNVYTGDGTSSIALYGAQVEQTATYESSYLPTLSTSVTRVADAASKTGISSLIGQTEGVIFIDFVASAKNQDGAAYSVITYFGDGSNNLQLYTIGGATLRWYALKAGAIIFDQLASQTLVAGQRYKIAYAYKSGDWALYINGVQKSTRTDANIPAVSQFNFNSDAGGASVTKVENKFNQVLLFKTRLTNAQLAELTTL